MGLILDTSVLIVAERGALWLEALLNDRATLAVGVAAVTASELLHGVHRAADAAVRARRAAFVEGLLDIIPVLPFGLREARRHAELWAELLRAGTPIRPYDMLIGATALARGDALATLNRRDFQRVPGLELVELERYLS